MKNIFILSLLALVLMSCNNSNNENNTKESVLHTSTGRTYELLVVSKNKVWNSPLGDTIKSYFDQTAPWLFAKEPYFDLIQIQPVNYGNLYKMYRNVLIVDIDDKYTETKLSLATNIYAKPQKVIKLFSSNPDSAINTFKRSFNNILENYNENEIDRVTAVFRGLNTLAINKELKEKHGFDIIVPKGFYVATDKDNFIWLRKEVRDIEEGILIYKTKYVDESQFNVDNLIDLRNKITKKEIPGHVDSSYMQVSKIFPPYVEEISFNSKYAVLIRSWWETTKYPMGGPFISYSFVDDKGENIITIDGYIYAPKEDKRDLLIQIESILNSFKFAKDNK